MTLGHEVEEGARRVLVGRTDTQGHAVSHFEDVGGRYEVDFETLHLVGLERLAPVIDMMRQPRFRGSVIDGRQRTSEPSTS